MPKVSIVIPTFNRAPFIAETLQSIRSQTFGDWECIVVDDGSTDETPQVVAAFTGNDSRFRYVHRPQDRKKGANACRNYGFELSGGQYVKWFDSDDLMHEEMLERQVALIESESGLDFVACLGYYFEDSLDNRVPFDAYTKRDEGLLVYNHLVRNFNFLTSVPLWKKAYLEGKKLFDETLVRNQDYDFHFRIIAQNPNFIYSRDRLYYKREGNADSISQNAPRNKAAQTSVLRVFDNIYDTILRMPHSQMRSDLLNHVAYRQLIHVYMLKIWHKASAAELYSQTHRIVYKVLVNNRMSYFQKLKIVLGYAMLSFGKGYGLLYLSGFDLVKKQ